VLEGDLGHRRHVPELSFEGQLNDEQIDGVIAYITSLE
jgi:hypothetical protein